MADGLDEEFRELLEAMTKAGEVLNDAGVPWAPLRARSRSLPLSSPNVGDTFERQPD